MKYYYTAREVQQHLSLSLGAFYYLVDTGKINRLLPPGKTRGFYSKHQIERLSQERLMSLVGEIEPDITCRLATLDDLEEEYELATLMLNGSGRYGMPTYQAWLAKNPETNFIVRDHGRLVAFMHVLPVKQKTLQGWMNGEVREWEISAEDVLPYSPRSSVECIIMSMVTTSDVEQQKRRHYGRCLIRGFLHFLYDLTGKHVAITRFYAASASQEATAMLRHAGFEERRQLGNRMAFDLDPLIADTRLAKAYKAVLRGHNEGNGTPNMTDDQRGTQTRSSASIPLQAVR